MHEFDSALPLYDKADQIIATIDVLNIDEKKYLKKYSNFGYAFLYKSLNQPEKSYQFLKANGSISNDLNNIRRILKKDFVLNS